MKKKGYLVISLDFELLWGIFDAVDFKKTHIYFENTRRVIPEILRSFIEFEIHATWATVGMLFNRDWKDWENNIPTSIPEYANKELSPYKFSKNSLKNGSEELVFANSLVQEIATTEGQEIGTHTYSHYYCLAHGQTSENFKADLEKAIELALKSNITLRSLVFPRNQVRNEYLGICWDLGITSIRTNPEYWYWKDTLTESLIPKLARSGDAYLPFGKKSYSLEHLKTKKNLPIEQPASRFLRPFEQNLLLNNLKINRIKREMTNAAKNGEIYHLWWHPHNFGYNSEKSMADLKTILEHYRKCQTLYGFSSSNMNGITERVKDAKK